MSGYHGYSMSNNAVSSYASGEKPLSRWTRSAILNHIAGLILDGELPEEIVSDIDSMKTEELKGFLSYSSWHHTSCRYNRTAFYSIDADKILAHFGYRECVCASLADGSIICGFYSGRDEDGTLQTFTTSDGQVYPRSDIVKSWIGFEKSDCGYIF